MKQCNQCGKCCVKYGANDLSPSAEDIKWWDQFKPNIYQYVNNKRIWFNPSDGTAVEHCPWLRVSNNNLHICEIYQDRPEDCRLYPSSINEMLADDCEMLEAIDLKDMKRAQIKLDMLMENSRKLSG